MGGVDLADRMMSICPSRARTKKWTVRCILHFFDLAISNAWLQMRATKLSQNTPSRIIPQFRTYKLDFGQRLIEENDVEDVAVDDESEDDEVRHPFADRRSVEDPSPQRRVQGANHLPEVTKHIQKRCAMDKCKMKSRVFCIKCNIYLCLMDGRNCFRMFHSA